MSRNSNTTVTRAHILALLFLLTSIPFFGQPKESTESPRSGPVDATYCDVSRDPSRYNHELLRVTGFITHGFEDFHLTDPNCRTQGFSVWLTYGGKSQSGTVYCCPGEGGEKVRSQPLNIEGVPTFVDADTNFRQFVSLLDKEQDTTVHGTFVGRFFSGEKQNINGRTYWGGAGHMGCCSLFVIQRVESFDEHKRTDLDYSSEAGWYENEGCKWGTLRDVKHVSVTDFDGSANEAIKQQQLAERGDATWAFTDPARVALEAAKSLYAGQNPTLHKVKATNARQVFRWKNGDKSVTIVVTRPYWLSFYSASDSVVWVATMVKEAGCTKS